ncbi:MAG: ATP-binding protein [Bacteroidota bacterium]
MNTVSFSVDAGLINRLGLELVGRAETAVSELVKNSYDADATKVNLRFIDSDDLGGTLEIEDNGHGMTLEQLVNGFMRISSTSKIDEPRSPMYKRVRAGRKGIGRFATHRLGEELTIITQTKKSENAIKVTINWDDYQINQNIEDVKNPVKYIPKEKEFGTKLIIKNLRENWTQAKIERVFRYVSDLLQPDFLSDKSKKLEEESRVQA